MLKNILEFILKILTYKTPPKQDHPDTTDDVVVNIPVEIETPVVVPEIKPSEVYTMLSVKEYQTYFKKIGLYTKGIDGVVGVGTKKAIYQFNTIFLNVKNDIYTENTDKLLRVIYNEYSKSVYMTDNLWQYFKNFKKTEYKCPKWCNGYPHEISIHLVMANQFVRNAYNKSLSISSGVRCQKHNDELPGSTKNSKHLVGQASDSGIDGISASNLRAKYKELPFVYYSYDITSKYVHISVNL